MALKSLSAKYSGVLRIHFTEEREEEVELFWLPQNGLGWPDPFFFFFNPLGTTKCKSRKNPGSRYPEAAAPPCPPQLVRHTQSMKKSGTGLLKCGLCILKIHFIFLVLWGVCREPGLVGVVLGVELGEVFL